MSTFHHPRIESLGAWIFQKDLSASPKWWRHFPTLTWSRWWRKIRQISQRSRANTQCQHWFTLLFVFSVYHLGILPSCSNIDCLVFTRLQNASMWDLGSQWWSCLVRNQVARGAWSTQNPERQGAVDVSCGFLPMGRGTDQIRFPYNTKRKCLTYPARSPFDTLHVFNPIPNALPQERKWNSCFKCLQDCSKALGWHSHSSGTRQLKPSPACVPQTRRKKSLLHCDWRNKKAPVFSMAASCGGGWDFPRLFFCDGDQVKTWSSWDFPRTMLNLLGHIMYIYINMYIYIYQHISHICTYTKYSVLMWACELHLQFIAQIMLF